MPNIGNLIYLRAFVFGLAGLFSCSAGFCLEGEIGIHDPSTIVRCKGRYYVFGTGRGIPILCSDDLYTWRRAARVFDRIPESVKQYVPKNDGQTVWAPDIINFNSLYYRYYSVSAWGQYVSAVGLLTSSTLDLNDPNYHWTDRGMVVHSEEGQNLNAIDPGVILTPEGRLWLCYGSYHGYVELVELDPKTGLRIFPNSPVYVIASGSEAAKIIYHEGSYYLFVNHGSCCSQTNSTYHILVGRSPRITGPYLDRYGQDLAKGAGTLFIASAGTQVGPGHFGQIILDEWTERFSCHYEGDISTSGRSFLAIRPLLWTLDGWPAPGEHIQDGTYQIRSHRTGTILQVDPNATNGSPVKTAMYLIRDHQKWSITRTIGGLYKILSISSGLALTARDKAVQIAPYNGAYSQLWRIDQLIDGTYRIVCKANRQALTALITQPGNGVGLDAFTGQDHQRWVINRP